MKKWLPGVLLLLFLFSCKVDTQKDEIDKRRDLMVEQKLMEINKYMVKRNRDLIENFIRRTGWKIEQIAAGVWYGPVEYGSGLKPEEGDLVLISYRLKLLDGKSIMYVPPSNPETFVIGKSEVISGLEKGVSRMRENEHARLILSPQAAYGTFGDMEEIPPSAILIFQIHLLKVKKI